MEEAMRSSVKVGDKIKVVTTIFPHAAPQGAEGLVVRITEANSPPVPYYMVRIGDMIIGLYRGEIDVTH
jgi:hypothetical protein